MTRVNCTCFPGLDISITSLLHLTQRPSCIRQTRPPHFSQGIHLFALCPLESRTPSRFTLTSLYLMYQVDTSIRLLRACGSLIFQAGRAGPFIDPQTGVAVGTNVQTSRDAALIVSSENSMASQWIVADISKSVSGRRLLDTSLLDLTHPSNNLACVCRHGHFHLSHNTSSTSYRCSKPRYTHAGGSAVCPQEQQWFRLHVCHRMSYGTFAQYRRLAESS